MAPSASPPPTPRPDPAAANPTADSDPVDVRPLLPAALLGAGAVLWLWLVPLLVLLALNVQSYRLIEGNMDAGQKESAQFLGWFLLADGLIGAALGWRLRQLARSASPATVTSAWWGLPALLIHVAYLWIAVALAEDMLPPSITTWIYPPQRYLYHQFAFAMLPLFWGIVRLACVRPRRGRARALAGSVAVAIAAPILLYAFYQGIHALNRGRGWFSITPYLIAIMVILVGVAMFVGIVRGLALWLGRVDAWPFGRQAGAILIFALAMPLGGLFLNTTIPFPTDFQAGEVYALTLLNAGILLLAAWLRDRRPRLSLGLLGLTLPFSLYFFTVFLPFLPLAPLAVIAIGTGFLVLTPTVLLILHLVLLNRVRRGVGWRGWLVGALCFLALPAFFTLRGLADKAALNAALDYVFTPTVRDEPLTYPASRTNLRRALTSHRAYKDGIYYPLLSDFYAWLVFDHLVLPDDKIDRLERTFFGPGAPSAAGRYGIGRGERDLWAEDSSVRRGLRMPRSAPPPRTVEVAQWRLNAPSEETARPPNAVTLTLTLTNSGDRPAEYIRTLPLPPGVLVSGFRLHINGHAVSGRITEKKTALWVYTMIRDSERRDPGLLFYNDPNELELRVFPVAVNAPSVVEVDFLLPEPLTANDRTLPPAGTDPAAAVAWLGEIARSHPRAVRDGRGDTVLVGLPATAAAGSTVNRAPFVHVVVDRSVDHGFTGDPAAALAAVRIRFPDAPVERVTLANYEIADLPTADATDPAAWAALPLRGGFVTDLALAHVLRLHRDRDLDPAPATEHLPRRPIVVIVRQTAAPLPTDLKLTAAWQDLAPDLEIYDLDAAGTLTPRRAAAGAPAAMVRLGTSVRPVTAQQTVRLHSDAPLAQLAYWDTATAAWHPLATPPALAADSAWVDAIKLQTRQQDYARRTGEPDTALPALVAASQASGIMIAPTSYIVVENAAQWRMLDVSERQKLDQNEALNFRETPAPPAVWLLAGFALWLVLRRVRARRRGARPPAGHAVAAGAQPALP